jgi:threonine/homoserine/homoserine lactone efflux protein
MPAVDLSAFAAAALGIALSPLPFVLAIALLGSSRPLGNAVAFVSGEALAIGGIATLAVVLTAGESDGSLADVLSALEIVVGACLAALLVVHLRRRPLREGPPAWSGFLDSVGPRTAFAGGVAMVAVNPKNLALTLAGAASIVQLGYSAGGQVASVLTFTFVAVSALLVLLGVAAVSPARSAAALGRAETFVFSHERLLVGGLLGALSAFFLLRGVTGTLT